MNRHLRVLLSLLLLPASLLPASCSGGGGGGAASNAPASGPILPPAGAALPAAAGLRSAVSGSTLARVDWALPAAPLEAALFTAADAASLLAGPPALTGLEGLAEPHAILTGLTDGTPLLVALGVREPGASTWTLAGPPLTVRPAPVLHVDPAADPQLADGSAAHPFPALATALFTALAAGGGNVWGAGADYGASAVPLLDGVHLHGGFDTDFDLATRDPAQFPSILRGSLGVAVAESQSGGSAVLDGFAIDGAGAAPIGVDCQDADLELRRVDVSGCTGRGLRVRGPLDGAPRRVAIVGSSASGNGADGCSASGSLELLVSGSAFDGNQQEGLDVDDLLAPDGEEVALRVLGSRFYGNGAEGLDVDLAAPLTGGAAGGEFDVEVVASRFERNLAAGLLIDLDYEAAPAWKADLELVGCTFRANRGPGAHLDLDAAATVFAHRALFTANAGDGLLVSSETAPGLVTVSASVAAGNLGAGVRATFGNRVVSLAHCVLAGNAGGGLVSEVVEASAASTATWMQPAPWTGARTSACVEEDDPLSGAFALVPEVWVAFTSQGGDVLTVPAAADVPLGATVEVADDGVARTAAQINGTSVTADPAPDAADAPGPLAVFAPGSDVDEDWSAPPGSPLLGAGLTPPGGPVVDAGVHGSPSGGAPGALDTGAPLDGPWFRASAVTPTLDAGVTGDEDLVVRFHGGALDLASVVTDAVRVVDGDGTALDIGTQVVAGELVVSPPVGGWGAGPLTLELHAALASEDGRPLAAPVALPIAP